MAYPLLTLNYSKLVFSLGTKEGEAKSLLTLPMSHPLLTLRTFRRQAMELPRTLPASDQTQHWQNHLSEVGDNEKEMNSVDFSIPLPRAHQTFE